MVLMNLNIHASQQNPFDWCNDVYSKETFNIKVCYTIFFYKNQEKWSQTRCSYFSADLNLKLFLFLVLIYCIFCKKYFHFFHFLMFINCILVLCSPE